MVEQLTVNQWVEGSSPSRGASYLFLLNLLGCDPAFSSPKDSVSTDKIPNLFDRKNHNSL